MVVSLSMLTSFIEFLRVKGVHDFNLKDFNSRLKLQKYVFIAKFFGLDMGYKFNRYVYGAYSPTLANDYYKLYEVGVGSGKHVSLNPEFDSEGFVKLVKGRNKEWLEVASTILLVSEKTSKRDRIVEIVREIKSKFKEGYVKKVLSELVETGILKLS